mgnify:CR=1 FL=1
MTTSLCCDCKEYPADAEGLCQECRSFRAKLEAWLRKAQPMLDRGKQLQKKNREGAIA